MYCVGLLSLLVLAMPEVVFSQPWMTRFDYDYEPVPIAPSRAMPHPPLAHRPIQMHAAPRYRPSAETLESQQEQLAAFAEPPPRISLGSSFGGSYGHSEPEQRFRSGGYGSDNSNVQSESGNPVGDFMSRLATTIPEIAEKMARMNTEHPKFNAGLYTFAPQTERNGHGLAEGTPTQNELLGNVQKSGLGMFFVTDPVAVDSTAGSPSQRVADLVQSMPDPKSFFSFDKLFSAFSGRPSKSSEPNADSGNSEDDKIYDMSKIHGTPILKDEDEDSESVTKPDQFVEAHKPVTSTEAPNPANNLLGTLLAGKLDQVDWLGAILGPNKSTAGEQNPISQILQGGFFGSGLDDVPASLKSQKPRQSFLH